MNLSERSDRIVIDVLISGCSIAGPTLAYWLGRAGHRVTIVERAPRPRPGGQAIDVRGSALQVLAAMGILDAARSKRTTMKGVSVVDADGNELWRTEEKTLSGGRFDSDDIEILRDDLADLLLDRALPNVEVIFGESVAQLEQSDRDVRVLLAGGESRRFDVVIGADGLRSNIRNLVFGDDSRFVHSLGVGLAVFSAPNFLDLRDWQIAHRVGRGGFLLYTARNNNELRVALGFDVDAADDRPMNLDEQKRLVASRCAQFRWEVPRFIEAMWDAPDFYFGTAAQVRMEHWFDGRCVLVGDAAYCPSPFSGQGTSLALVGGSVLATELGKSPSNPGAAFHRYQERMRAYVDLNQALAHVSDRDETFDALTDTAKNAISLEELI